MVLIPEENNTINIRCTSCLTSNPIKDIKLIRFMPLSKPPVTDVHLCKSCRDALYQLLSTQLEAEKTDPIKIGARVYVQERAERNRCAHGTIIHSLTEDETKRCNMWGRLIKIQFDDGYVCELTRGYEIVAANS